MAKTTTTSNGKITQKPSTNFQFVNYDLSKSDKETLAKSEISAGDLLREAYALIKEGYKISCSWDDYSDCIQVILIGAGEAVTNHGLMMSSRASSFEKALAACLYKHHKVFEGNWAQQTIGAGRTDDF